jgi:hypothetical protein
MELKGFLFLFFLGGHIALDKGGMNRRGRILVCPLAVGTVFAGVGLGTRDKNDCTGNRGNCEKESRPGEDQMAGRGNTCEQSSGDEDVQWDTEEGGQLYRVT